MEADQNVAARVPGGGEWLEIVVPARNEALRLPTGLAQLCKQAEMMRPGVSILVVDSASTDGTAQIVRQWPAGPVPVRLIRAERPGKGTAVRTGLLATRAPFVGFCDVDMATDLSALEVAVSLLEAGHPVVIGSRAHRASVVEARHSVMRVWGAAMFRGLARNLAAGVSDTQCGFKFFSGPLARAAAAGLTTMGYAFDIELIVRCRLLGAEPTEIPVRWRDVPGSTFSAWRHSVGTFRDLASIWLETRSARRTAGRVPAPDAIGTAAIGPVVIGTVTPAQSVPDAVSGAATLD
jgi:dolichyl-phosphate beta-glucosyltransferase